MEFRWYRRNRVTLIELDPKETALFIDFDGTLTPIVARPELARPAPETLRLLSRLAERHDGAVAVLSGRRLADLDELLAPLRLPAAGSHGVERRDAGGRAHLEAPDEAAFRPLYETLAAFARRERLLLEPKPGGAALHFRSRPELETECRALADRLVDGRDDLRVIHGSMVAEIAPARGDKGTALSAFMTEPPFLGRTPVAVGDDTTDEDAFAAAQELGGVGIRIGFGPSGARCRLPDIDAFLAWLRASTAEGATP